MRVNFHVERLVLDGDAFRGVDRAVMTEALGAELSRLLSTREVPAILRAGGALPEVRAGNLQIGGNSQVLGEKIGRAVHKGFTQY